LAGANQLLPALAQVEAETEEGETKWAVPAAAAKASNAKGERLFVAIFGTRLPTIINPSTCPGLGNVNLTVIMS
jgi:hypothetical protein